MILRQLARRDFALNKKRSVGTIIGITLSVALIMAVATLVSSLRQTLIQRSVRGGGYYHVELNGVTPRQLQQIRANRDVKTVITRGEVGLGEVLSQQEAAKIESDPNLHLLALNQANPNRLGYKLLRGTWATKPNEIVVNQVLQQTTKLKVGTLLMVKVGQAREKKVKGENGLVESEDVVVNGQRQAYRVTGIMADHETNGDFQFQGLVAPTKLNHRGDAFVSLRNPRNYRRDIPELLGLANYKKVKQHQESRFNYAINDTLLAWEVFAFSDSNIRVLMTVAAIVIAIIMLTSVFCIRNSFAISTTEKIKTYGMLASVGATKRQIRQMVFTESAVLAGFGIPLGLILGAGAAGGLVLVVNHWGSQELFGAANAFRFSFSIAGMLLAVGLSLLTIYLSARGSAKAASKVSPIEQIRNQQDVQALTKQTLKTPRWVKRCFSIGGVMAYKNLRRSRKKYRTTVISLTISIFTFIAMTALLQGAFATGEVYYKNSGYNLLVYLQSVTKEKPAKVAQILALPQTSKQKLIYEIGMGHELSLDQVKQHLNAQHPAKTGGDDPETVSIVGFNQQQFQEYGHKLGLSSAQIAAGAILYDQPHDSKGKPLHQQWYDFQAGDQLAGHIRDDKTGRNDGFSFKLGAVSQQIPKWLQLYFTSDKILILNQATADPHLNLSVAMILLHAKDADATAELLQRTLPTINYSNLDAEIRSQHNMKMIFSVFLYGFIGVIILIGVTNIFNTITANMALRQKEFAALRSVGMTNKEFKRMVNLETLFYSSKSLIWGIILGVLGSLGIYRAFNINTTATFPYSPPWLAIAISIIFVFLLVFWIMRYSLRKINRQNIIETIRRENI